MKNACLKDKKYFPNITIGRCPYCNEALSDIEDDGSFLCDETDDIQAKKNKLKKNNIDIGAMFGMNAEKFPNNESSVFSEKIKSTPETDEKDTVTSEDAVKLLDFFSSYLHIDWHNNNVSRFYTAEKTELNFSDCKDIIKYLCKEIDNLQISYTASKKSDHEYSNYTKYNNSEFLTLVKGFRGKLEDYLDLNKPFKIKMRTVGNAVYDTCCFGVDTDDKISDDRYTIFYNQPASPDNEIVMSEQNNEYIYEVDLLKLPDNIVKLLFTVSIDGNQTMGQIRSHVLSISQNNENIMELNLSGIDFHNERAIIGIAIYKKSVWRIWVTASGFDGGLTDLFKYYGGEVSNS